jgi:hypothetical protein
VKPSRYPSLRAPPLQSSFVPSPRPQPFGSELDLPRFLPSSRLHACASTCTRFPGPVTFRPQAFTTSRRFPPHTRSQAYFILLPRPGSSCSRSSPFTRPPSLVGRSVPPYRYSSSAHRPKSVATANDLGLEAFIRMKMRSAGLVIHRPAGRSLLQVFLLQVLLFLVVCPSLPGALHS